MYRMFCSSGIKTFRGTQIPLFSRSPNFGKTDQTKNWKQHQYEYPWSLILIIPSNFWTDHDHGLKNIINFSQAVISKNYGFRWHRFGVDFLSSLRYATFAKINFEHLKIKIKFLPCISQMYGDFVRRLIIITRIWKWNPHFFLQFIYFSLIRPCLLILLIKTVRAQVFLI